MGKNFKLLWMSFLLCFVGTVAKAQNPVKIGSTGYATLQAAVDDAFSTMTGDVTINIVSDISGYTVVRQKQGLNMTISGGTSASNSKTINGQIMIDGCGSYPQNTLTIEYIKFTGDGSNFASRKDAFISVPNPNTLPSPYTANRLSDGHNITISNCDFTSTASSFSSVVGFKAESSANLNGLTISNVTGNNLHSLAQLTGTTNATFDGCTITGSGSFIGVNGGGGTYSISNCTFESHPDKTDGYAIRVKSSSEAQVTLADNDLKAPDAIILGNAAAAASITVTSGSYTGTVTNSGPGTLAISGGEFVTTSSNISDYFVDGFNPTMTVVDGTTYVNVQPPVYVAQIGETQYETLAAAVAAATEGQTIQIIKDDTYTLPGLPQNVTIEGTVDGVVFNHTSSGSIAAIPNGATFKNVEFNFGNVNYHGFQHAGTINMEGCTLNGKLFSYADMNFTDCAFNQTNADYHMWAYSGNITYTDCTFTNTQTGKFINIYNESGATKYTVTVTGCNFINQGSSNKAALNVKSTSGSNLLAYDVIVNNCTTEGAFPAASSSDVLVVLNSLVQVDDRPATGVDNITVTQDGELLYPSPLAKIDSAKYPSLQSALDAAHEMSGNVTIELLADITGYATVHQKAGLNITIDGANKTVNGQIFIDGDGRASGTETLTIQNIAFVDDGSNFYTGTDAFILVPSTKTSGTPYYTNKYNYAHNVTISGCSFTSTNAVYNQIVAIKATSGAGLYNAVIDNCTGTNLHSLAQLTGTTGGSITGNTVTASESFLNVSGGSGDFTVSGNTFTTVDGSDGYGVRENGTSTAVITLTDNTFTAFDAVKLGKNSATAGTINVVSGTYYGNIVSATTSADGKIVISGGRFSAPLADAAYAAFIAEGLSGINGLYPDTPDTPNGVGTPIASVTDSENNITYYTTFEAAWNAVADGETITLLADCSGNGLKAPQGKFTTGLTVDFGGFTYTVDGVTVGSSGTETQAFQLLKDNNITFTNGTIYSEKALMLVQNYSNLTLQGMTLTLANDNYASGYTLSNNNGIVVIDNTTINANTGGGFAFDVCRYASYPSVSVTVTGGSTINGDVEVSASGSDPKDGFSLTLDDGTIDGDIVLDATAQTAIANDPEHALAVITKSDGFTQDAPAGYKWISNGDGTSTLGPCEYVAQIGTTKYESIADAVAAATDGATITLLTDIDLGSDYVNINKAVTIDGAGFTITSSADQAILLTGSGDFTLDNTKVVASAGSGIKAGTDDDAYTGSLTVSGGSVITVAKRGINVWEVGQGFALTVTESTIQSNVADPTTDFTTGNDARGINLIGSGYTVTLTDATVQGFAYNVNLPSSASNITVNITGGTYNGWSFLNNWGDNNEFNANGATVTCTGMSSGGVSNKFQCIVDNVDAANCVYTITNCTFTANPTGTVENEDFLGLRGTNAVVKILGSTTFTTTNSELSNFIFSESELRTNGLYFDATTKVTFADAFEEAEISEEESSEYPGLYPVTYTPEVLYYWATESGYSGNYYKFAEPFENGWLDDGEFIALQKNITLTADITCGLTDGESFNLLLGNYTITKGEYSVALAVGVSVNTDKQTDIFSVPENCTLIETATADGYQYTVVSNEDAGIFDLVDGEPYPYEGATQITPRISYTRTINDNYAGKYQCWYVPFDYNIKEADLENCKFYKIHMISGSRDSESSEVANNTDVYIHLESLTAGTKLTGNRPYVVVYKTADTYTFEEENTKIYAVNEGSRLNVSTAEWEYDFYGTYDTFGASGNREWMSLSSKGKISWNKDNTAKLGSYRWCIKITPNTENDDYSNLRIGFIVDGEEDTATGIYSIKDGFDSDEGNDEISGIYTVNGAKVKDLQKGVNIIRYNDGTTKKVLVK